MIYRKLKLCNSSLLNRLVYDVYELTTTNSENIYSTVPNGIIGISIVLDGRHEILSENEWHLSPPMSVYGLVDRPDVIKITEGFKEIAIGFNPYYLQLLLKNSMADISGGVNKNAFNFFKKDELNKLYECLVQSKNDQEILTSIELFLMNQLVISKEDKRLEYAIDLLYKQQVSTVSQLSAAINLSTVSTRNLFYKGVGRTPKEIIKILRIHKTLQAPKHLHKNLTQLAYYSGFFDQSHFIRDFKKFFGFSPSHYFKNPELTFDFYNYSRWNGNIFEQNSSI